MWVFNGEEEEVVGSVGEDIDGVEADVEAWRRRRREAVDDDRRRREGTCEVVCIIGERRRTGVECRSILKSWKAVADCIEDW